MIGKKIKVYWPVDKSWYTGIVEEYHSTNEEHLLRYSDGDTEWVKIGSEGGVVGPGRESSQGAPSPIVISERLVAHFEETEEPWTTHPQSSPPQYYPPETTPSHMYPPPQSAYGYHYLPSPYPPPSSAIGPYPGYFPPGVMPTIPPMNLPSTPSSEMREESSPSPPFDLHNNSNLSMSHSAMMKRKAGPKIWTKEEDLLLLQMVQAMKMPMKWSVVAQSLPERTGKQCRERYVNHLNPRLKVADWSPVEDATIFNFYNTSGSHWAQMSKMIPGRTDNGIKNRFHNLRRQLEREDEHRLRLSSETDFPEQIRLDRIRELPQCLRGKSDDLWNIQQGIGILAAQSVLGGVRSNSRFGPSRHAHPNERCVRCGLFVPSVQTGLDICSKSGWCTACTRIPPHVSGNLLRECLNLRRADPAEGRAIIESWEEFTALDQQEQ